MDISPSSNVPIVVLNWNGWDDSIRCISSIYSAENTPLIWLVDNGSDQDLSLQLKEMFPELRIILLGSNYGWAVGNNKAIEIAASEGYDYIYLINNDSIVEKSFLSSSINFINDHIATVGSQILYLNNRKVIFDGEYALTDRDAQESSEVKSAEKVNGAGMLVSIKAYQTVGPFDARFFCYHEETEWCERASKLHGLEVKINLGSIVRHAREGSDISGNSLYYRTRNSFIKTPVRFPNIPNLASNILEKAKDYRQNGNNEKYVVMMCALHDGLNKNFGYRKTYQVTFFTKVLESLYGLEFIRNLFKKGYQLLKTKFKRNKLTQ